MNNKIKITFIGEDPRQYAVARMLLHRGYDVCFWGFSGDLAEKNINHIQDPFEAFEGARAAVLPIPSSVDGIFLNSFSERKIRLEQIAEHLRKGMTLIGGKLPESFRNSLLERGIGCGDYLDSEAFQIENAYITAEAALFVAMQRLDRSIRGARCAITGYGRIGKNLAAILHSLGANVSIFARKESDRAWAKINGCESFALDAESDRSMMRLRRDYDVIFNTVPARLFGEEFLFAADANTLIVELASAPGGIDVCAARKLDSNILWALSLPGKYAPRSAGELMADAICSMLEGGEEE